MFISNLSLGCSTLVLMYVVDRYTTTAYGKNPGNLSRNAVTRSIQKIPGTR